VTGGTLPGLPLANFFDAHGHRVTAELTRSGLLAILTQTADEGLNGGHPALNRGHAETLRDALDEFIAGEGT
jgi:hypothetical protein